MKSYILLLLLLTLNLLFSSQIIAQNYVKEFERLKARLSYINAKIGAYSLSKHYVLYIKQDKKPNYDDFDMGQSSLWYYD